ALEYASQFCAHINPDSLALYERLIREGAWWDFVDHIAISLVGNVLLDHRADAKEIINKWTDDHDMWIRRTSLICHNHHKLKTDRKQLFAACKKLAPEKEFFIRKAIGWALREYSYHEPQAVIAFVQRHESALSPLSMREATRQLVRSGQIKAGC
ncbi:MAG: DNA alkylation repair protein, partial [Terriglobales bacterium]